MSSGPHGPIFFFTTLLAAMCNGQVDEFIKICNEIANEINIDGR